MLEGLHSFWVDVEKTDNASAGKPAQGLGNLPKGVVVIPLIGQTAENDRVISPDDPTRPYPAAQSLESLYFQRNRARRRFEDPRVMNQGILEVVAKPHPIQFVQIWNEGIGVSCPKDNPVHIWWLEADSGGLARAKGGASKSKTTSDPVHKPCGVIGWYVSSSTGANDHGSLNGESKNGNLG